MATSPDRHTCVIQAGSSGTAPAADVDDVVVVCRGPDVRIGLSGQWGWIFDPEQEAQTFSASIVAQDVSLTISGDSLVGVTVDGVAAMTDRETAPIPLPAGTITVPVVTMANGGLSKTFQLTFNRGSAPPNQVVYGKASNTDVADLFGWAIAISGDTLAVGAPQEASSSFGINSGESDNARLSSGAVYVFTRIGGIWAQQAYLKASNPGAEDRFGSSISLSGDTLAVSAPGEDSSAVRVGGNQADDSTLNSGAVYVFKRNGSNWTQQEYIKASTSQIGSAFGRSLAISGDEIAVTANQLDERTDQASEPQRIEHHSRRSVRVIRRRSRGHHRGRCASRREQRDGRRWQPA